MVRFTAYDESDEDDDEVSLSGSDAPPKPRTAQPDGEDEGTDTDIGDDIEIESASDRPSPPRKSLANGRGRASARRGSSPPSRTPSASSSRGSSRSSRTSTRPPSRAYRATPGAHLTDPSLIPWAQQLGIDTQRMHVMQAALFSGPEEERQEREANLRDAYGRRRSEWKTLNLPGSEPVLNRKHSRESEGAEGLLAKQTQRASFGHDIDPVPFRPSRKYARVDRSTSAVEGNEGALVDAGLAMGRSFRVGWGPGGTLVHLGRICSPSSTSESTTTSSTVTKTRIPLAAPESAGRPAKLLQHHLSNTTIEPDADGIPFASPSPNLNFSSFAALYPVDRTPDALLFRLGHALFDPIDVRLPPSASAELVARVTTLRRRLALSQWLEDAVTPLVEGDLRTRPLADAADAAFTLLTGHQVSQACTTAADGGYAHLATLLAQAGGDAEFRADIAAQLEMWREERVDAHIEPAVRRIYALLAGVTGVLAGSGGTGAERCADVRVNEGLDWKRTFGLHLWYAVPLDLGVREVWEAYERAREEDGAAAPVPWYVEKPPAGAPSVWRLPDGKDGRLPVEDALYSLIHVHADPACTLSDVLNPFAFGTGPLDYGLSWHLYVIMSRSMRVRDFADRGLVEGEDDEDEDEEDAEGEAPKVEGHSPSADLLASAYASQLEAAGLLQQAAFVLLHMEGSRGREKAVKDLLARSAPKFNDWNTQIFVGSLKLPMAWIDEAKAIYALGQDDAWSAYQHYLSAGNYNAAHDIAVLDLAPEAVIRNDLHLLRSLFERFGAHWDDVEGWHMRGQAYLDYVHAITRLDELQTRVTEVPDAVLDATDASELEDLGRTVPRLISLLPDVLRERADPRHKAALTQMISGLVLRLDRVQPMAMAQAQVQPALIDDSTRLRHIQAMAMERFMQTIGAS